MIGDLISHWEFWGTYGFLLLPIWRYLSGYYAHSSPRTKNETDHLGCEYSNGYKKGDPDWTVGFWAGLGTVLFWPLVISCIFITKMLDNWPSLLRSNTEREFIKAREKKRLAEHVRRIEEDTGL